MSWKQSHYSQRLPLTGSRKSITDQINRKYFRVSHFIWYFIKKWRCNNKPNKIILIFFQKYFWWHAYGTGDSVIGYITKFCTFFFLVFLFLSGKFFPFTFLQFTELIAKVAANLFGKYLCYYVSTIGHFSWKIHIHHNATKNVVKILEMSNEGNCFSKISVYWAVTSINIVSFLETFAKS